LLPISLSNDNTNYIVISFVLLINILACHTLFVLTDRFGSVQLPQINYAPQCVTYKLPNLIRNLTR